MSDERDSNHPADQEASSPAATGTVAGAPGDIAGFGPLQDPPQIDNVEIIGGPADDEPRDGGGAEDTTFPPPGLNQDDEEGEPLQSGEAVSTPFLDQPGFVLPPLLMQRAEQIGQDTAAISAEINEIERANDTAEPAAPAEPTDPAPDKKESK